MGNIVYVCLLQVVEKEMCESLEGRIYVLLFFKTLINEEIGVSLGQ